MGRGWRSLASWEWLIDRGRCWRCQWEEQDTEKIHFILGPPRTAVMFWLPPAIQNGHSLSHSVTALFPFTSPLLCTLSLSLSVSHLRLPPFGLPIHMQCGTKWVGGLVFGPLFPASYRHSWCKQGPELPWAGHKLHAIRAAKDEPAARTCRYTVFSWCLHLVLSPITTGEKATVTD